MDPIIETVLETEKPTSKPLSTFYHPEGVRVPTRVVPLIADLEAAKLVGGFLSHSATYFCTYCLLKNEHKGLLDFSWISRTGKTVREQAAKWLHLDTTKAREKQGTETGVRWCSLHR
ncbi:hypothetical protein R3P38DRAFT_2902906, partial [Favolaschia claudopus]